MTPLEKMKYVQEQYLKIISNPDYVMNRAGQNYISFRNLKADPHIWSSIQQRKSGVISLDTKIKEEKGTEKIAEEVTEILKNLDTDELIRDILEAPLFGFQPLEIIWELKNGKLLPNAIEIKKQEHFTFDSDGKLKYYKEYNSEPQEVPKYKILLPRYEANAINPYGQSLLSKCFWMVQFKYGAIKSWEAYTDKYGSPLLLGKYKAGATKVELNALAKEIAKMLKDQVIVVDTNFDLEMKEQKTTSSKEIYNGLANYCNTEISKAILSQTLTTELNIGSYAAANIHYKIKREVIQGDIKIVEQTINELIKYYVELNYGIEHARPVFEIIFTNQDNIEQIQRDEKINKIHPLSQEYLIREYSLNETDFEKISAN